MNDREIRDLLFQRDEEALRRLTEGCGRLCRRLAFDVLGSTPDAEEVLDDALLQVWNTVPPADPPSMKSYLMLIVRSRAIDRLRSRERVRRGGGQGTAVLEELADLLPDSAADGRDLPDRLALKEALAGFLKSLDENERTLFLRRYWWFTPVKEIAAEENLSVGAVKMRLARTREKLRDHLRREGFEI
ncbi:MAG: sigma-70 family RNA polymerase sigma factor [Clostridia bacterium]|nr:sigma-70 family RNA polymerase sigma factor [Clostridia bacterium]